MKKKEDLSKGTNIKLYEVGFEEGRKEGLETGLGKGKREGYAEGYREGVDFGRSLVDEEMEHNFEAGYDMGHSEGYELGYKKGIIAQIEHGENDDFEAGYDEGLEEGHHYGYIKAIRDLIGDAAYEAIYEDGFNTGFEAGKQEVGKQEVCKMFEEDTEDNDDNEDDWLCPVYINGEMTTPDFRKGYDTGYKDGYSEGYTFGEEANDAEDLPCEYYEETKGVSPEILNDLKAFKEILLACYSEDFEDAFSLEINKIIFKLNREYEKLVEKLVLYQVFQYLDADVPDLDHADL